MMAAAALSALNNSIPQLNRVHSLTKSTAAELEKLGYKFSLPVQTNMIVLDLEAVNIPASAFVGYCEKEGLIVFGSGRLVFHYQTSDSAAARVVRALTQLMADKNSGKKLDDGSDKLDMGCS